MTLPSVGDFDCHNGARSPLHSRKIMLHIGLIVYMWCTMSFYQPAKSSLRICTRSSWIACSRHWSRRNQHLLIACGAVRQGYHTAIWLWDIVTSTLFSELCANRLPPLLFPGQSRSWEILRKRGRLLCVQNTCFLLFCFFNQSSAQLEARCQNILDVDGDYVED